jgi:NTP pyrophosphatase (non-canonical NTP hydrolase)
MLDLFLKVKEFRYKSALPIGTIPHVLSEKDLIFYEKFVQEEMEELRTAVVNKDIVGTADAIGDLIYLLIGAAHMMALPLPEILEAIHEANMKKIPGSNKRGTNDSVKPIDWVGPEEKIRELIDNYCSVCLAREK